MITAVYILRDCEKTITDSLNSLLPFKEITEIVCVIDARSRPELFEIVQNWLYSDYLSTDSINRASVEYYDWKTQNFSNARNYGIDKATNDWILTIDGDETLIELPEIDNNADFYEANILNKDRKHLSVRLFKNDKNIFFEGVTHETVEHCLKRIKAIRGEGELIIKHTGYDNLTAEQLANKVDVLLESYIEQIKLEPENPRVYYNLCTAYYSKKQFQDCIDYGYLCLFKPIIPEVKAQVCLIMYFAYKELGKSEVGIHFLLMSDEIYPSQSSKAKLCEFYKSINDLKEYKNKLTELKEVIINGSRFPNDINIDLGSVEQKLKEIT